MTVPALHEIFAGRFGATGAFRIGTVLLLVSVLGAILAWPESSEHWISRRMTALRLLIAAVIGIGCCYWTASRLLPVIFAGPLDAQRGDMLVVIQAGVGEFLAGHMPYRIYQVPWDAPLPYGPTLWLPYVLPYLAHADERVLPLWAYLFVVSTCIAIACIGLRRTYFVPSACVLVLAGILTAQADIARFFPIGHTPVYWPLLVVLCVLLRLERWIAAAALLGLLVSARSTMVSVVPVFLIAAYHRRVLSVPLIGSLALTSVGPFVPFLLRDPGAVWYAMVGSYAHTMKSFVWANTTRAHTTYGLTSILLTHGWQAYVEVAQVTALLITYALAWRPLATSRPEPWMAGALLVFSMTTLWPVLYVYFDVWVLLISGLIAALAVPAVGRGKQISGIMILAGCVAFGGIVAAAAVRPGSSYVIDVGTPAAASFTGGGFRRDEASFDSNRDFVWVADTAARVRLPRAGWRSADIQLDIRPFEPVEGLRQTLRASLNGKPMGMVSLKPGWQTVSFTAPFRQWNWGFNVLDLELGYAITDLPTGRKLSVGIDTVSIR